MIIIDIPAQLVTEEIEALKPDDFFELDLRLHAENYMRENYIPIPKRGTFLYERVYDYFVDDLANKIKKN